MRLFVAVDLDDRTRARVGRSIDALRAVMEQGRSTARILWIAPDRLHVTLQFIGEASEDVAGAIATRLDPPFELRPFDMQFDRIGTFPSSGRPRVVWLDIARGAEGLALLHAEVERRLAGIPYRRESRAFSPHLTLARFKDGGTRADRERITTAELDPAARCTIDHVTLYRSRLSPRGPTYTPLRVTPLAPRESST